MTAPVVNKARRFLAGGLFLAAIVFIPPVRADDKLKPEDLVAKHLEAIGLPEARAKVNGTRIKGTASVSVRLCGEGTVDGEVLMASTDSANLINMSFPEGAYSQEALRYDGKKFAASQLTPGSRTCLAQFFLENEVLFKEGLVGGTLSESWPLLNLAEKNPKLEYSGLKKIGDKQVHALKYGPRKGADVKIVLYFDPETFRHVRTDYSRTIYASEQRRIAGGGPGLPPPQSQQASPTRIEAYEEFADFKAESGLTLPHSYKFHLSIQSEVRPAVVDWVFNLTQYSFTSPLDAADFTFTRNVKN
ncbi:MAG TPA: hypothetical protein VFR51_18915 [Pyrinomonadaceae bacterium]|nr:hypothetical protein [Pyrinomonadaceae bacterium]